MRVIAGTAKGKRLKAVPQDTTRPITDRTKEALFSILGHWIIDARVLDLFGGTGAVGIEALSRGAGHVTFIDANRAATQTIGENLRTTGLADRAYVKRTDAFKFLKQPPADLHPFDLIYIAPPQYKQMWLEALHWLNADLDRWLLPDGAIIVQIHPIEFQAVELQHLTLYDERKYGSTLLCFYERLVSEGAQDE
ncbi:MAG: 16S rRNA (guanine(966)-N(2))-methyltransferase RsmD [Anaerolineaceae bacterium]|nr:16S rRNA (guanine(966)-N(2))-methyltransferase RsmD [Anaerolineaceae bacterium]MCB9101199.1 16S rRNA (guanine(966)-N(2))-methyltransferase RsmD [Anaerolineales bacterium]